MLKPTFTTNVVTDHPLKGDNGEITGHYYKISLEPLEQGYGNTLGNALRRVLLNSIAGAAITKVTIKGVTHQFTTLEGVSEDIVDFILNVKQIRLALKTGQTASLKLEVKGPKTVKAGDIVTPPTVKIVNPNLVLAHLASSKNKLEVEFAVEKGIGYAMAEQSAAAKLGEIPVDALFSPITRVSYNVEATRVGRRTDFDKLILEVYSDGTIDGVTALNQAAKVLVNHFRQIYQPENVEEEEKKPETASDSEQLSLTVEELDIPTRIANALRRGGYKTVEDLTETLGSEIAKVKNLGEKSIDTVAKALKKRGLHFKEE